MLKHILFPTDGSEAAHKAPLAHLKKAALDFGAEVTLLHTYEFTMGHVLSRYHSDAAYISDIESNYVQFGEKMLSTLQAELEEEGVSVRKTLLFKGDAGEQIIKAAHSEGCDLILMGNRGEGVLKSVFLGSTSRYVVNHSKQTPVFLVPVED